MELKLTYPERIKKAIELYEETIGEYAEYLPFDSVFDPKWLNATAKDKDIEYDISEKKTRVISDINVIKSLKSEIENELLEIYKSKGNTLAAAIERNQQIISDNLNGLINMVGKLRINTDADVNGTRQSVANITPTTFTKRLMWAIQRLYLITCQMVI